MKLFHELISHYAATTPEKIALQDAFGEMSYHDLEMTSASCSEALIALGVKQGDTVAVYVPYVKEIMVGAVAALRTGGIFAPFDSAYPETSGIYARGFRGNSHSDHTGVLEQQKAEFP